MARAATIRLITKDRRAHGVHEETQDRKRIVFCTVRTVRQSEYYQAQNAGYRPEYQFDLTRAEDYRGETSLLYEGREYAIIRLYEKPNGGLEIVAERSERNEPDEDEDEDSEPGQDAGAD